MGALLGEFVRRHLPLVAIAAVVVMLFLGSFVWLGVNAYYVWAAIITGAVILAARHDLGDGAE